MNTIQSAAVKTEKVAKPVVDVAIVFTLTSDPTVVAWAAQMSAGENIKTLTGTATDHAMTSALKAVVGSLKTKEVHLNVRHNHSKFQSWLWKTAGATEQLCALLGVTLACNNIKPDDARLEVLRTTAKALPVEQPKAEAQVEAPAQPAKTRKSRKSKTATAAA